MTAEPNRNDPERTVHWELCYEGTYEADGDSDRYSLWAPTVGVTVEDGELVYGDHKNVKLMKGTMQECLDWISGIHSLGDEEE